MAFPPIEQTRGRPSVWIVKPVFAVDNVSPELDLTKSFPRGQRNLINDRIANNSQIITTVGIKKVWFEIPRLK